jgi:hypothetical protein
VEAAVVVVVVAAAVVVEGKVCGEHKWQTDYMTQIWNSLGSGTRSGKQLEAG